MPSFSKAADAIAEFNKGGYKHIAQSGEDRKFYVFKNSRFLKKDLHLCEYITENSPRRMYVDYEDYFPLGTFKDTNDAWNNIVERDDRVMGVMFGMNHIFDELKKLAGEEHADKLRPVLGCKVREYTKNGTRLQKLSIHIIFKGMMFANHEQMLAFVNQIKNNKTFQENTKSTYEGEGFDFGVYSKNQGLRLMNQTKNKADIHSKMVIMAGEDEAEAGIVGLVVPPKGADDILFPEIAINKRTTSSYSAEPLATDDVRIQLLYATHERHFNNHNDWVRIGFCCINEGIPFENFLEASKKSVHWSDVSSPEWVENQWKSFKTSQSQHKITQATLWAWLKEDDYPKFKELSKNRNDLMDLLLNLNHNDTAKYYWNEYPDLFVYHPRMGWFELQRNKTWKHSAEKYPPRMRQKISTTLQEAVAQAQKTSVAKYQQQSNTASDQDEREKLLKQHTARIKALKTAYTKLGSSEFINGVMSFIHSYYLRDDLETLMNQQYDIIAFDDCVFDCKIGKYRDLEANDWVSTTTGYNAPKLSNPAVREELKRLFYSIFEDEETATWLVRVLASSLYGRNRWEQIYVATGTGSNGKGVIAELMRCVLGGYYYSADIGLFTKPIKNRDQPMPALVESRYARMMMTTEPEKDDHLQTGIIKKISGNDTIEARTLHSKDIIKYTPQYKVFIQTNGIPQLNTLDGGIQRRIRIVNFPFKFVGSPVGAKQRRGDPDVKEYKCKSDAWRDEMMLMLLETIMEIKDWKDLPMSKAVEEATNEYLGENDPVGTWVRQNFEITGVDDADQRFKASDLYQRFKNDNQNARISTRKFADLLAYNGIEKKRYKSGMKYYGIKDKVASLV